jgi:hypothetical protein
VKQPAPSLPRICADGRGIELKALSPIDSLPVQGSQREYQGRIPYSFMLSCHPDATTWQPPPNERPENSYFTQVKCTGTLLDNLCSGEITFSCTHSSTVLPGLPNFHL